MVFKIALVIFAVFAICKTYIQYRAQSVSRYWLGVFVAIWLIVVGVALFPASSDIVARVAGVGRGADLIVYVSVVVLLYAMYRLLLEQRKMHEDFTELVRKTAIIQAESPKDRHHE